jgi:hypothetical protein
MLSFPAAIKVYLRTIPCDMQRSLGGLSMMAEHVIGCNLFSGHLLVFCNRRSDRVKILYRDRDGWAIWVMACSKHRGSFDDLLGKRRATQFASLSKPAHWPARTEVYHMPPPS